MKAKKLKKWLILLAMNSALVLSASGCGNETKENESQSVQDTEMVDAEKSDLEKSDEKEPEMEKDDIEETSEMEEASDRSEQEEENSEEKIRTDRLLEQYYEDVLVKKEGVIDLPSGYELAIKERHMEGYSIGESYLEEYGICYHAVWDYDKDEEDELLVLVLDEDKDYKRSKIYARMYEAVDGEVVETAELESFFGWMEFDTKQSTEIMLRETKDWFYLAEEAYGLSSIYADGSWYAIRVAHYDGKDFVVDLAKQIAGSDFSETKEEVADTARLLTYIGFDNTAKNLTYQYSFDKRDDLLSVFYMTGEISGSLDKYYETWRITDVPPYMVRLYDSGKEK